MIETTPAPAVPVDADRPTDKGRLVRVTETTAHANSATFDNANRSRRRERTFRDGP
jgi:hypothetical protein